jgi:hypothetical protein
MSDNQHKVGQIIVQEFERLHKRNQRFSAIINVVSFAFAVLVLWMIFALAI